MPNLLFFDYESSDTRVNFGQVCELSFILTDDRFKILEKKELKCRLKPNVVPNIRAMLVNSITPQTLKNAPLSHYQLVLENYKWFKKLSPTYFTGFNITSFDIEFYRRMLFKSLIPDWYQTNTNGNKIHDVLPQVRAAKFINRNCIATKLNPKGNDSFKLQDLAEVGNFNHGVSHSSTVDCLNTIEVAKKVKQGAPEIWEASLKSAHRTDAEKVINSQKIFTTFEFFYGRIRLFLQKHLFYHNLYRWSICWDLKHHPKDYINLDRENLSKALQEAPKVIRTFKQNKNNVIMNKELGLNYEPYDKIGMNEILERSKILDQNPQFINSISSILEDLAREKKEANQIEPLFEETIYAGGINISSKDKINMNNFHKVDLKGKLSLIEKFTEERYFYFAKCLLYEEYSKEQLPESLYNEMHKHFAKRLTSTDNEKWETFASFYKECDDHREKYKDDENKLKILEGYNNYVEEMEKKFENV
tara:strand:- start:113 stop:1537 length:1425 start_codon:yes stop_codon:yes gene_type:complete